MNLILNSVIRHEKQQCQNKAKVIITMLVLGNIVFSASSLCCVWKCDGIMYLTFDMLIQISSADGAFLENRKTIKTATREFFLLQVLN